MTAHGWFNAAESVVWILVAATVFARAPLPQRTRTTAAIALLAFAVSDIIEISTGAWWRPWWLFALKAACVLTFTPTIIAWLRLGKTKSPKNQHQGTED